MSGELGGISDEAGVDCDRVDVLWEHADPPDLDLEVRVTRVVADLLDAAGASQRTVSIVLTDDPQMAEHNRQWRGEDGPTDVLSFPMDEGEQLDVGPDELACLGDIVISLDTAARQAAEHGYSTGEELAFLLIHGLCHLLGHDHGEPEEAARMRAEEDRLLALVAPGQRRPPTPY